MCCSNACLSSTAHSQNPDLLPHHWECMETSSAASAASTAHLQLTNIYIYLSPIFLIIYISVCAHIWYSSKNLVEPCDPENNCTLSLSLQVWNSSNSDVYPWQVKVQKKQKRKRKRKGGTPYVFRHTAA